MSTFLASTGRSRATRAHSRANCGNYGHWRCFTKTKTRSADFSAVFYPLCAVFLQFSMSSAESPSLINAISCIFGRFLTYPTGPRNELLRKEIDLELGKKRNIHRFSDITSSSQHAKVSQNFELVSGGLPVAVPVGQVKFTGL